MATQELFEGGPIRHPGLVGPYPLPEITLETSAGKTGGSASYFTGCTFV